VRHFRFLRNPQPSTFGNNLESFLLALGGPACLYLDGCDSSRTRALVTLQHGNEPSGAMALFRYLRSGQKPAVNVVCIVPSVPAALEPPLCSHRMLPRARDLNRCFRPPFEGSQGRLAEEILEILHLHNPEAVLDIHNTSGSGPGFAVVTHMDRQHDALASLFTDRMVISNLGLGALMEISESLYPTVTIEVGGRLDEPAHELAYEGLCRYFGNQQVLNVGDADWGPELFVDPIRLELGEHTTLCYADERSKHHDITLKTDIEHHNFGTVDHNTLLGWVGEADVPLFTAIDKNGNCALDRLIRIEQGKLYPAGELKLFMITSNPAIATTDCLFYAAVEQSRLTE